MDSESPAAASSAPVREPGSMPLRNHQHELFARERAICQPLLEAARRAGYTVMTPGNAAKIDRMPKVRERIAYLAGNTEDAIRAKRHRIEEELNKIAFGNVDRFLKVSGRTVRMDWGAVAKLEPEERAEVLATIQKIIPTRYGLKVEAYSKSDAIAQLRKLNGLDAPERIAAELTGKDGTPLPAPLAPTIILTGCPEPASASQAVGGVPHNRD